MMKSPSSFGAAAARLVLISSIASGLAIPVGQRAQAQERAVGVVLAQRTTKPGEPAPPAPPPPPIEPRSGVMEAPKPSSAEPPAPTAPKPAPAEPAAATELLRIIFPANTVALPDTATPALDKLVAAMKAKASMRVLLKAYSSTGTSVSETRRVSLQRGMAVRLYLTDKGIAATRIDLQPLGTSTDGGPGDRVDVFPGRP